MGRSPLGVGERVPGKPPASLFAGMASIRASANTRRFRQNVLFKPKRPLRFEQEEQRSDMQFSRLLRNRGNGMSAVCDDAGFSGRFLSPLSLAAKKGARRRRRDEAAKSRRKRRIRRSTEKRTPRRPPYRFVSGSVQIQNVHLLQTSFSLLSSTHKEIYEQQDQRGNIKDQEICNNGNR